MGRQLSVLESLNDCLSGTGYTYDFSWLFGLVDDSYCPTDEQRVR